MCDIESVEVVAGEFVYISEAPMQLREGVKGTNLKESKRVIAE
jgi:hypothetical protein